jgi:ribosomal protein S18 acetylase RimI-like enzyme
VIPPEALEAHRRLVLLDMARTPQAEERNDDQVHWVLGGSPAGFFNCVVRANLLDDAPIEAFQARLRARGVPGTWHFGPSMRPLDLPRRLLERGFEHVGDDSGMALDLADLPRTTAPPNLSTERVHSRHVLARWVATMLEAFDLPEKWSAWFEERSATLGFAAWSHYLGYLDGQPVATASSFTTGDLVGIYNVGTIGSARRRGIGIALTHTALAEARARGAKNAVLHASDQGYSIYRQLGFQTISQSALYRWRPEL